MPIGFALSGGGNLGSMQAGAILGLVEAGIEPDLIVGSSVGALNAAFLSSRPGVAGAKALVDAWCSLKRASVVTLNPLAPLAGLVGVRDHLFSAKRLRTTISGWIETKRIEDARLRFAVATTDALTGEVVLLQAGDATTAVCASTAIPGLFPALRVAGRWLIDGSLAAGWPIPQAQELGATDVYLLTTTTAPRLRPPRGAVAVAMNSVSLVTARVNQELLAAGVRHATAVGGRVFVVPTGSPNAPGPYDLSRTADLVSAGYEATRAWVDATPAGRRQQQPQV